MRARLLAAAAAIGIALAFAGCGGKSTPLLQAALIATLVQPPTPVNAIVTLVSTAPPAGTTAPPMIGVTNSGVAPIGGNLIIEVQFTSIGSGTQDILLGTPGEPQYYDISNIPVSPAGTPVTINIPVNLQLTAAGGSYPVSVQVNQGGTVTQPAIFDLGVNTTR